MNELKEFAAQAVTAYFDKVGRELAGMRDPDKFYPVPNRAMKRYWRFVSLFERPPRKGRKARKPRTGGWK